MRIESVTAHAFGPLAEETLELGRGMTVIQGPNESGKSTWHAALYAGLCGIRRARGRSAEIAEFRERHRPWDGNEWKVSMYVSLADGRRVQLSHDLEGRVDCKAVDADLGRDYSDEIMFEGAPDGSLWLGLDRKSFLSTACVRQADIQDVIRQAGELQDHLQKAAATAGVDETAATAIETLDRFRRENVGQNWQNSTRPLRTAHLRTEQAQDWLKAAQERRLDYLLLQGEIEQLQKWRDTASDYLALLQAAHSRRLWQGATRQASRARELADRNPLKPADPSELRKQVEDTRTAVRVWENRPSLFVVNAPSSDEIARQILDLPPMPKGDTRPHPGVVEAERSLQAAISQLEGHRGRLPPQPESVGTGSLAPQEVRQLAVDLALDEPEIDPALDRRVETARARLDALQRPESQGAANRPVSPLLLPFVLLFRLVAALLMPVFGRRPRVDYEALSRASEELRHATDAQGEARFQQTNVRERKETATSTAVTNRLPTNPKALTGLAERAEQAIRARANLDLWQEEGRQIQRRFDEAANALKAPLEARGEAPGTDLLADVERYRRECEHRDEQARQAARRPQLEQVLEEKRAQEAAAEESGQRRNEAAEGLVEAARAAGVSADTEDLLIESLRQWAVQTGQTIHNLENARQEWRNLQELLDGKSLADLEDIAKRRAREAEQLCAGIDEEYIASVALGENPEELLEERRQEAGHANTELAAKQREFELFIENMPSVADAEEEAVRADAELTRVTILDRTLEKTLALLKDAQDRVHRDLAPKLRESLRPWLRAVTNGRYQDLRVDPESLKVTVSGNGTPWRDATLLSHGTAEQIYLLLRVVMTRYLTKPGETCPLILDDITVHCDPERQTAILSLLHQISAEQQVILFSQEPETLEWALANLSGPDDNLIHLNPKIVQA